MPEPNDQQEPHLDYQVMSDLNREPLTLVQQGVVGGTLISTVSMSGICFIGLIIIFRVPNLSGVIFFGGMLSVLGSFFLGTYLWYHRFSVHIFYTVAFYVVFTIQIVFLISMVKGIK